MPDWDGDGRITLVDWQAFRLCYEDWINNGCTADAFEPPCGEVPWIFVFDPGAGPPPDTQCGCPMTMFPARPQAVPG